MEINILFKLMVLDIEKFREGRNTCNETVNYAKFCVGFRKKICQSIKIVQREEKNTNSMNLSGGFLLYKKKVESRRKRAVCF